MDINLSLLGQAITFAMLVWFTMKFVWPPLTTMLDERANRIAEGLAAADRAKLDLELASKQSTEKLREAKAQSAQIVAQAQTRAAHLIEEAKNQAIIEADKIKAMAEVEIAQEVVRAKETLRKEVAQLAVKGAEQILRHEVDRKRHSELLAHLEAEL